MEKKNNLLALKIIFAITYLIVTIFLVVQYVEVATIVDQANKAVSLALYLAIFVIIFGGIGYGLSLIISIVGLIFACIKKVGRGTITFFITTTILPIISETIFVLLCVIQA